MLLDGSTNEAVAKMNDVPSAAALSKFKNSKRSSKKPVTWQKFETPSWKNAR